ncbi:MAG: FtsQ-type POTRA domain-containing protein [Treponemataceae bacterium]|nr:FtsQ-type POTRA domain-containing protein [Treponemataceae bacterium]
MSDGFVYTEYGRYFEQEEEKKKASDKKFKVLKILVLILSAVLIINVVLYAIVFPCFSPANVVFTGLTNISASDILKNSGMDLTTPWVSFDKKELESRLASNPALDSETLKIEKKFPDQVLVYVNERVPVVLSLMNIDNRTRTVQIDKNGVVFSTTNIGNIGQIPLVTGLELEKVSEGFHISATYKPLLDRIAAIAEVNPVYLSALSEIHVKPLASGNYELIVYPIHSRVRVIADRSLSEETLRSMLLVLDFIDSVDSDITEIDMRYGSMSYKKAGKTNNQEVHRE